VTLYRKPPNSLEEPEPKKNTWCPKTPNNVKGGLPYDRNQISRGATGNIFYPEETVWCPISSPSTLLPRHLIPSTSSHRLYPLQLIPGGDKAHIPFRLSEFKEIKKDLGNYTKNPDQYI
jgi:hypothetical protein